jgi:formyltetrahydrofolate deformylase
MFGQRRAGDGARRGATMSGSFILTLACDDRPGIVASVAGAIFAMGGNITEARQFEDAASGLFFARVEFAAANGTEIETLRHGIAPTARKFGMDWKLRDKATRKRVVILVSRFDHCLADLLYHLRIGSLKMDVRSIISNHSFEALNLTSVGNIPFRHFPVTRATREFQEAQIRDVIENEKADLVVLARYMQVLSSSLVSELRGRCVNIHHSFLPGFKGAKPYHQAFERGVKMIGATAHFVTSDLDEGPIIAQEAEPVTHADAPEDLIRKGRDIERRVLSRTVGYLIEDRVFLNGSKTVVFPN